MEARRRTWVRRAVYAVALVAIGAGLYVRSRPRAAHLPLATLVDGPSPKDARVVLVYLHGRNGSLSRVASMASALRGAGLPSDVSIVFVEAPFGSIRAPFGRHWGNTAAEQASSRARIRARIRELTGDARPRVVVAGFSQGAGVAIDLAASDPDVRGLASFSPCFSFLRGELPKREDLRVLLAHGTGDGVCAVEESRSLASALEAAHKDVKYIEFDGAHVVPPEVVRALAALASAP